jgi:UDP-glucose 4-epimerase
MESLETSTVLVTGVAGFIGSHLVESLLEHGAHRVIALDNLRAGSWQNLDAAAERFGSRLERVTLDFAQCSEETLATLLQGVTYLYHLAAEKHRAALTQAAEQVLAVNVTGTARLFQLAVEAGVHKTVFTSSLYAYGQTHPPAMQEQHLPKPSTIYGLSKLSGEHLLHWATTLRPETPTPDWQPMRTTVLRLFFVYGPRQFAGTGYRSVILTHFERIRTGKSPIIFGDGQQALDYIYIDDVVRALLLCLASRADGETLNIGSQTATTVANLTQRILAITGSSLQPDFDSADWTAGTWRVSDSQKARTLLNWVPQVSLDEGLQRVAQWYNAP